MKKIQKPVSSTWYLLDNAANLYTAISNDRNTNVFRLSCDLREKVDKALLQKAVDKALRSFTYFQVVLRRGLFWFYLEKTDKQPVVKLETDRPCARLFFKGKKELLFQVTYFGNRINLEVFHALADGGGAFELLREIVFRYLIYAHSEELPLALPPLDRAAPPSHQAEDSFAHHYDPREKQSPFRSKAYSIQGTLLPGNAVQIISAKIPTGQLLRLCKERGVTLTAYLATLMICSVYSGMVPKRHASRTIAVTIPVDLRGHFQSETTRNFFSVVELGYNFGGEPADFDRVLEAVTEQMVEKLQPDKIARRVNYSIGVQNNIFARFTPLALKNFVLRVAYRRGEAASTCALSNLGRITMPEPFLPYIEGFHCLLNPTTIHRVKACVASFQDSLIINFTSCIAETKVQKAFFRHLSQVGLDVCITCNGGDDDEEV